MKYRHSKAIAWLGSLLLAFCALPEAYRAVTATHYDISTLFLAMWGLGELCLLYIAIYELQVRALIINYSVNTVLIAVMALRILLDWFNGV